MDELIIFNRSISAPEARQIYFSNLRKYSNSSWSLAVNQSNLTDAQTYTFQAHAADALNNFNDTAQRSFTTSFFDYFPQWQANLTNISFKISETKFFSINWTDDKGLSAFIFSWNGSNGSWKNYTAVTFTGTVNFSNQSAVINLTRGNTIGWRFYANNTLSAVNSTDVFTFVVENTPPSQVNLSFPLNGSNITERFPVFNWSAHDPDGDALNFTITIDESDDCSGNGLECVTANINTTVFNTTRYNRTDALGIDTYYNWTVVAWDGFNSSTLSGMFNFTLQGLLSLTLSCTGCNERSNFGDVVNGVSYNTTTDSPQPLILENGGNVLTDIRVNATPLWSSVLMDTVYYQFAAGNSSEAYSFNWSNSTIAFRNMNANLTPAIDKLNFSNATNRAEIELRVRVPDDESPGQKTTTITVEGKYYD